MIDEAQVHLRERRVLLVLLGVSFAATTGTFLLVGVRFKTKPLGMTSRPRVQWLPQQNTASGADLKSLYVAADIEDPSLGSLPSLRGFSRQVWARSFTVTQNPQQWKFEPAFLEATAPAPFQSLLNLAPLADAVQSLTEKAPAESEEPPVEPIGSTLAANQTVLHAVGALEGRVVIRSPQLPALTSETPLRPTRLRVGVASDGTVRYATLERSCGDEAVDSRALDLARQVRFEPLEAGVSEPMSWGVIKFLWATAPPGSTTNATRGSQP